MLSDEDFVRKVAETSEGDVLTSEEELAGYVVDGIVPKAVAFPKTPQELSHILVLAGEEDRSVVPRGGGSKMAWGSPPRKMDLVVCTRYFDKVVDYDPSDLTVTVQAGLTLAKLQSILAHNSQFLPLDPASPSRATIGGVLATNTSGPRRLRYGAVRDILLGIKMVNPTGKITKAGGKVVKNVAGYDLRKLYIGSFGTLGVIYEASFKISPIPEAEQTVIATIPSSEEAFRAADAICRAGLLPSSVEVLDLDCLEMMRKRGLWTSEGSFCVAVCFGGVGQAVERQIHESVDILRRNDAVKVESLDKEVEGKFWTFVRDFPELEGSVMCKVTVLNSRLCLMLKSLNAVKERYGLKVASVCQNGVGVTYFAISLEDAEDEGVKKICKAVTDLRREAVKYEGHLIIVNAPVEVKKGVDVWGAPPASFFLMQAIKAKIDPKNVMNPGRFVGGI